MLNRSRTDVNIYLLIYNT